VFADLQSAEDEPALFGITDGKAVGTYLETKFRSHLAACYSLADGNAALGLDFPSVNVDLKVTSIDKPQSSCPYQSARQKVFGLGYSLLVLVYDKQDDASAQTARLTIRHVVFIEAAATGDYTLTKRLRQMVEDQANVDDIVSYLTDRNLPGGEDEAARIAAEVLQRPPEQGALTISNALQWRLKYGRAIDEAGRLPGVQSL
jgi:hypothetical protein